MTPHKTILGLILIALAVIAVKPAQAQQPAPPPITASVDVTELTTDDTVTLTVVVTTQTVLDPPLPDLPPLGNLVIIDQGTTSRVFIQNNRASIEVTHTYVLRPTEEGALTIAPITVEIDDETFSTQPIFLDVVEGGSGIDIEPSSDLPEATLSRLVGQDFLLESFIDKQTPYVGEQVTYTTRFFRSVNIIDQPSYDAPSFTGFWSSEQPTQERYRVRAAGSQYDVLELHSIVFPASSGTLTISPATMTVLRGIDEPETVLRTTSLGITVFPLPEGAPRNFTGAVGRFDVNAELEATSGIVNDPVIMNVTISGQGNPNTLPDPEWPEIESWRSFESESRVETRNNSGTLTGRKVYERIMIPSVSGEYTVPPISYSFFDPVIEEYRTVSTRPMAVTIIPGASGLAPLDVQQLKPGPLVLSRVSHPLTENGIYWIVWGLPVILVASVIGTRLVRDRLRYDTPEARRRNAHRKARSALKKLSRNGNDPYALTHRVLTMYITDKLDQPVHGMTYEDLGDLLISRGVDPDLAARVTASLAASEAGRYARNARANGTGTEFVENTRVLISDLEKGIRA